MNNYSHGREWFIWKRNPPFAHNIGGGGGGGEDLILSCLLKSIKINPHLKINTLCQPLPNFRKGNPSLTDNLHLNFKLNQNPT